MSMKELEQQCVVALKQSICGTAELLQKRKPCEYHKQEKRSTFNIQWNCLSCFMLEKLKQTKFYLSQGGQKYLIPPIQILLYIMFYSVRIKNMSHLRSLC